MWAGRNPVAAIGERVEMVERKIRSFPFEIREGEKLRSLRGHREAGVEIVCAEPETDRPIRRFHRGKFHGTIGYRVAVDSEGGSL